MSDPRTVFALNKAASSNLENGLRIWISVHRPTRTRLWELNFRCHIGINVDAHLSYKSESTKVKTSWNDSGAQSGNPTPISPSSMRSVQPVYWPEFSCPHICCSHQVLNNCSGQSYREYRSLFVNTFRWSYFQTCFVILYHLMFDLVIHAPLIGVTRHAILRGVRDHGRTRIESRNSLIVLEFPTAYLGFL